MEINNIMQFRGKYKEAGLGESGEVYLVGKDYKMEKVFQISQRYKRSIVQKLGPV